MHVRYALLLPLLLASAAAVADPDPPVPTPVAAAHRDAGAKSRQAQHATTTPKVTSLAPIEVKARAPIHRNSGSLAAYGNASVHDTPAAITVIDRQQLDDAQVQDLRDLPSLDAAVGYGYAPVGYIQDLTIRGYPLNVANGFRINDLTVTGQQFIALENKQQVQILQGLPGIESGVMQPGGVINYVSERPADVHTLTLGTDSHGSRYAAVDFGRWLTPDFGVRFNAATAAMHSFVEYAHGHRHFYSIAADWRIAPRATLELDSGYQGYAQHSVSAYQLLGGVALPQDVDRHQLLAYEPWGQPTTVRASNTSARLKLALGDAWHAQLALGHSRSRVLDNVAFAYGCTGAPGCAVGPTPSAWFAPNGDYAIWDYRSPGETYSDNEARATLDGHIGHGFVVQDLTVGASVLDHTTALPNEVFDVVGIANIAMTVPPFFPPSPSEPGPVVKRLSSWQRTLFALDRVHLGEHWQVVAGGQFVRLDERQWGSTGAPAPTTFLARPLPQAALLWQPTPALTTYVSYSRGLALGQQAPYWATNAGATLPPQLSSQIEAGAKYRWHDRLDLGLALYRIHQPYQFAAPDGADQAFTFVQRGQQVNTGIGLSAHGSVTPNLRLDASVAAIRAIAEGTGVPAFNGHQVQNVPRLRATLRLDYTLPARPRLALLAGWQYASPNVASPDGRVRVPAWNVFDAGLRYTTTWGHHRVTWRLMVDNLFDRFYWIYTGNYESDDYLYPGAPRVARLTVEVGL